MYHIKSNEVKPNLDEMLRVLEICVSERGLRLSSEIFNIKKQLEKEANSLLVYIIGRYNINNPNSPKQVLDYMTKNLSREYIDLCTDDKTGKISSNKENLEVLVSLGISFAIDLLNYRRCSKKLEYVKSLLECSDKYGRIFPSVSLGNTNRINYTNPPLMNIPKDILWSVLRPIGDGNYLFSVDIKNQEPTVIINWLNIEKLKPMLSSDKGLYFELFKDIFHKEPNKEELKELKVSWNALTYGATSFGLKSICTHIDSIKIYEYFNNIKELKNYRGKAYGIASNKGRRCKTYFGTQLFANAKQVGQLQRQLMDFPIQGTCSDILSLLISRFYSYINENDLSDKLSLYYTRHDELIIEVDKEFCDSISSNSVCCLLDKILSHKIDDWVEFKLSISLLYLGSYTKNSLNLEEE